MVTNDLGACEWFVWDLRRSGLIDRGQLDLIVSEFLKRNPRAEAPALAEYLVQQGTLTAFQADRILNGKTAGLVLGPYVLLDAIGQGSMGQVYKASSKNDANLYAVKVLPRRSMWNVRLARRQVRAFSQITHPSVVPFVDVGTAGGLHYLVWPLVDGITLENLVQQQGRLTASQTALIGVQVCQGLTICHQNSIFHGLLKPSNIMIGSDNQTRLLDFGIGSLLVENEGESLVDTMSTANTLTSGLDCAAPESIMDPTNRTPAGDQYSLGCVLYYCVTGHVPFPEGSAVEKMMAHQTKDPTSVRDFAPETPDGLIAVISKLMSKRPEDRYTGVDEVLEALEPYLGELAGAVIPESHHSTHTPAPRPGLGSQMSTAPSRMPGMGGSPPSSPAASGGFATGPSARMNPAGPSVPTPPRPAPGFAAPSPGFGAPRVSQPTPLPPHQAPPRSSQVSLPSRASFQLPDEMDEVPLSPAMPSSSHQDQAPFADPAARASTGWLTGGGEEAQAKKPALGTLGIIAVTLLLTALVYFGAMKLLPMIQQ